MGSWWKPDLSQISAQVFGILIATAFLFLSSWLTAKATSAPYWSYPIILVIIPTISLLGINQYKYWEKNRQEKPSTENLPTKSSPGPTFLRGILKGSVVRGNVMYGKGTFIDSSEIAGSQVEENVQITELVNLDIDRKGSIAVPGFEFNIDQDALSSRHTRKEQIESAHNIYGAFLTGRPIMTLQRHHKNRIRSIILPDPMSPSLLNFQNHMQTKERVLAREIIEMTKEFKEIIKWFPYFTGQSWLIGKNQNDEIQWVHIEIVFPFSDNTLRPSFRIEKETLTQLLSKSAGKDRVSAIFANLQNVYLRMEQEARSPTDDDIRNAEKKLTEQTS